MTGFFRVNVPVMVVGLALLFGGASIIFRGRIWDLALGDERFLVGGIMLLIGMYFSILALKKPDRED